MSICATNRAVWCIAYYEMSAAAIILRIPAAVGSQALLRKVSRSLAISCPAILCFVSDAETTKTE